MAAGKTNPILRGEAPINRGARGVSRLASSDCLRHRVIIAAGTTPEDLAPLVYPTARPPVISPFAVEAGLRFEAELGNNGAEKLLELYRNAGIAVADPPDILVCDEDPVVAERQTRQVLDDLAGGKSVPDLVFQARLGLTVAGVTHGVRPDVLTLDPQLRAYRVGEIKSYLDRDGKTDGRLIAAACRQGAVGILALAQTAGVPVGLTGVDMVLRRDDASRAALRTLDVQAEIHAIERAIGAVTRPVLDLAEKGVTLDRLEVLESIDHRYRPSCHGSCALADACFGEALRRGDLAVLGDGPRNALEAYPNLNAALVALDDAGAEIGRIAGELDVVVES